MDLHPHKLRRCAARIARSKDAGEPEWAKIASLVGFGPQAKLHDNPLEAMLREEGTPGEPISDPALLAEIFE